MEVGVETSPLAVGDKHHAVGTVEHKLAGGRVVDLAGHRIDRKAQAHLADTLHVQLEVIAEENVRVILPSLAQELGEYDFSILDSDTFGPKLLENNRVVRRNSYHLEPILAGIRMLPSLKIIYKTDGKSEMLITDPVAIEVTSPFDTRGVDWDPSPADIKPLVAVKFKHPYLWLWITAALLVLVVLAILVFRRYRRKHQGIARRYKSAHQLAFERIDELESRKLLTQGLFKPFYEEISFILRWYIEDRFEVKAPERTTEEFLRDAQGSNQLNDDHTDKLHKVLVHCDLVKFACYRPDME